MFILIKKLYNQIIFKKSQIISTIVKSSHPYDQNFFINYWESELLRSKVKKLKSFFYVFRIKIIFRVFRSFLIKFIFFNAYFLDISEDFFMKLSICKSEFITLKKFKLSKFKRKLFNFFSILFLYFYESSIRTKLSITSVWINTSKKIIKIQSTVTQSDTYTALNKISTKVYHKKTSSWWFINVYYLIYKIFLGN